MTERCICDTRPLLNLGSFRTFDELVSNPSDDGGDESIEDTLRDLANYSIMTLMALREQRGELDASTEAEL